ncbi:helix-turn-helix domain-containing protein [Hymenobacter sp. BT635]|uniref:Helix-turn-helix domain-containing protein n=1 Tax=Hymenobacter nitidus TaxID=2880929 RepID=A0ABS8AJ33_9BACT|nr:helix-turn-helix domain-containing protein [Hymenobacter nitidus]MCB2380456.1 helix-turn-helix domain-containing protein [Hymenobacter nitidus]
MDNPFEAIDGRLRNIEALVLEILQHQRAGPKSMLPEVGGIELAQEITQLSKSRVYALVSARKIPHAKRGNKLYFSLTELQSWISAGKRFSGDEIE